MASKQVLLQLDEDLVQRLDILARELEVSRSELLRRGARAVLDAAHEAAADERLREAYRQVPQDPLLVASAARLAAQTAPDW